MGFGSYDESEQENQSMDTDLEEGEAVNTSEHDHEGAVEYEFGETTSDDLLDQLSDIKDRQGDEAAE
jgi:hypothetical protein